MSSSIDHKCQRCGSPIQGQICPFCTITGLDVNALLASEGLVASVPPVESSPVSLLDVVSNKSFPVLTPVCRFGRDMSNDIVLSGDKSLSRFHFQVTCTNNDYFVEDAGSRNGTFLNGSPVTAPRKMLNGDIISAGMSRFRFVVAGEEANPEAVDAERAAAQAAAAAAPAPTNTTFAVEKPSGPPELDPVDKLFMEGQALLGRSAQAEDEIDDLFSATKPSSASPAADADGDSVDAAINRLLDEAAKATGVPRADVSDQAPTAPVGPDPSPTAPVGPDPSPAAPSGTESGNGLTSASAQGAGATSTAGSNSAASSPTGSPPTASTPWPAWCTDFTFSELDDVSSKMAELKEEIEVRQLELKKLEDSLAESGDIKNRLLAARDAELVKACTRVFEILGWECHPYGSAQEVTLGPKAHAAAIARIVCTDSEPEPADMAGLVSSQSTYWSEHRTEPKGILLVAIMKDGSPEERPEISADYSDYAARKNVCVMTPLQLLAIYRDVAFRGADAEKIKEAILAASGQLQGFSLKS